MPAIPWRDSSLFYFIYLFSWNEREAPGATKGKKNPEVSTANHVGSRFSAAAQMTALNYAELFNWTAVVWFLLRGTPKETASGWRPEVTWGDQREAPTTCCPCHSPLQPPQPALAASGEQRASPSGSASGTFLTRPYRCFARSPFSSV